MIYCSTEHCNPKLLMPCSNVAIWCRTYEAADPVHMSGARSQLHDRRRKLAFEQHTGSRAGVVECTDRHEIVNAPFLSVDTTALSRMQSFGSWAMSYLLLV